MRDGDGQDSEARKQDVEEKRKAVAGRHPRVRRAALRVQPAIHGGAQRVRQAGDRDHGHHPAPALGRDDEVCDDREQHEAHKGRDGRDLAEVGQRLRPAVFGQRRGEDHLYKPACATEVISCVSAYGYRPMANMRMMRGVTSASWPAWMSPEALGPTGSPCMAPWNMRSM